MKLRVILISLITAVLVLLGVFLFGYFTVVEEIHYVGNVFLKEEKLNEAYFPGENDKRLLFVMKEKLFPKKSLSAVKEKKINIKELKTIEVVIEETEPFCELKYGGAVLVLNADGILLGASAESLRLPEIKVSGNLAYAVSEKLVIPEEEKLDEMLLLLKVANEAGLHFSSVYHTEEGLMAKDAEVQICFGDAESLYEKMQVYLMQVDALKGLSGIMYLNQFEEGTAPEKYIFKVQEP